MKKLMALSLAGVFLAGTVISSAQAADTKAPPAKKAPGPEEVVEGAALGCIIIGGIVAIATHGLGTPALAACAAGAVAGAVVKSSN